MPEQTQPQKDKGLTRYLKFILDTKYIFATILAGLVILIVDKVFFDSPTPVINNDNSSTYNIKNTGNNPTAESEKTKKPGDSNLQYNNLDKVPKKIPENTSARSLNFVHTTETADYAVAATINQKVDRIFGQKLVGWLQQNGTASTSVLTNSFFTEGYFDKIVDGNSAVIANSNAARSVKYLCLARISIIYGRSELDEMLVIANCRYEVSIYAASSGTVIDHFEKKIRSSGVSENGAAGRAENEFWEFLKNKNIKG